MKTATYTLPTHWASALINGDWSGLDEHDEEALTRVMHGEALPDCLDVHDDSTFCKYHDAQPYGVLACDCSTFVFSDNQ